jgi:hypothetical protein
MPKELNGLSGRVLSHWLPAGNSSHAGAGRTRCGEWCGCDAKMVAIILKQWGIEIGNSFEKTNQVTLTCLRIICRAKQTKPWV